MSTTILSVDLPPELILCILEHSVGPHDMRFGLTMPYRDYPLLRNTALVCKAWVAPSQTLLWRYVSLCGRSEVNRWIDSPTPRQYATLGLSIHGWQLRDSSLQRVLSKTVGLQTLHLMAFDREFISAACLSVPELKGGYFIFSYPFHLSAQPDLTALILSACHVSTEDWSGKVVFSLRSLRVVSTKIQPPVLAELLRTSAGTLESLDVDERGAPDTPTLRGLYASFPRVARTVRTLRITDAYTSLVPHLASCIALKRLVLINEIGTHLRPFFNALSAPLEDLFLESGPKMLGDTVQALDCPSLSQLQRLHLGVDIMFDRIWAEWPPRFVPRAEFESARTILEARNITVLQVVTHIPAIDKPA
ncbi:hypothetical protein DFH07DRAFT_770210 [Mycena maculata]|uniref:F-box domain-containing protein n=1 Tax=Mycena maculata TaxID=230809 RepID=A0AAD7JIF5_9AGAR|nr:hypothetical protein DFH07DRAFT_770210 [Mycena maculata]